MYTKINPGAVTDSAEESEEKKWRRHVLLTLIMSHFFYIALFHSCPILLVFLFCHFGKSLKYGYLMRINCIPITIIADGWTITWCTFYHLIYTDLFLRLLIHLTTSLQRVRSFLKLVQLLAVFIEFENSVSVCAFLRQIVLFSNFVVFFHLWDCVEVIHQSSLLLHKFVQIDAYNYIKSRC